MCIERYKLTVSGIIEFRSEDYRTRDLLLSKRKDLNKLEVAKREIDETAKNVEITLERLP